MLAELHSSWGPRRLLQRAAGAGIALIALALLAFAVFYPIHLALEPREDVIEVVTIKPAVPPELPPPVIPLKKIDLPVPKAMVNFPEFEKPVDSQALPSLAPVTSSDGVARPSGNETRFGRTDGTGRTNGAGSIMKPPIRKIAADAPFSMSTHSRSGLVTSLNFCVTAGGKVSDAELAVTSGFDDMDQAAIKWLEGQRFKPGTLDGVAAKMCATYDVRWTYSKATPAEAQAEAQAHAAAVRERSRYPRQFVHWPYDRPFPGCDAVDICRMTSR